MSAKSEDTVKVVVRVRPLLPREAPATCVRVHDDARSVTIGDGDAEHERCEAVGGGARAARRRREPHVRVRPRLRRELVAGRALRDDRAPRRRLVPRGLQRDDLRVRPDGHGQDVPARVDVDVKMNHKDERLRERF